MNVNYSVLNFQKTIAVDRGDNNTFLVTNLASKKVVKVPSSEFLGNVFKYSSKFNEKFISSFEGTEYILYSQEASSLIEELLYFNGIDN